MFTFHELFENKKIIKTEDKLNYTVQDYKNPPKKDMKIDPNTNKPMYRRKKIIGKDGKEHLITLAIMNKPGKQGGHTQATSKWDKR